MTEKFLAFLEHLYTSYPPMTFREYQRADGNHTNWFPQRCYQTTASMYREWFTLAVLNNYNFIVRVYKHLDKDALKIFEDIINSREFDNYIYLGGSSIYDSWWRIIKYCIRPPLRCTDNIEDYYNDEEGLFYDSITAEEITRFNINIDWDFDIGQLIDYYNDKFQRDNINTFSKNIKIANQLKPIDDGAIESRYNIPSKRIYKKKI